MESSVRDTAVKARDYYLSKFATVREQSQKCIDYALGKQWTDDEIARYTRTSRAPITVNILLPVLNTLIGQEQLNRSQPKIKAREYRDIETVELLNKNLKAICEKENLEDKLRTIFLDGLIRPTGGWLKCDITMGEDGYLCHKFHTLDAHCVMTDDFRQYDMSDCAWVMVEEWLTPEEIREKYGMQKEIQEDLNRKWYDRLMDALFNTQHRLYSEFVDRESGKFCVLEMYRRSPVTHYKVVDKDGKAQKVSRDKADEIVREGGYILSRSEKAKIHLTTIVPAYEDMVLIDMDMPFNTTMYPVFAYWSYDYNIPRSEMRSIIEELIDTQDIVNKRISQLIDYTNRAITQAFKIHQSEQEAVKLLQEFGSKPGIVVPLRSMDNLEAINPGAFDPAVLQVVDIALSLADRISQSNSALRGESERSGESNAMFQNKLSQTYAAINQYFHNLTRTRELVVKYYLETLPDVYWEEFRTIDTMEDGAFMTQKVNLVTEAGILRNVRDLDGLVVRSEGDESETSVEENRNTTMAVVGQMPPDFVPWHLYIRELAFPQSEEWAAYVEQRMGIAQQTQEMQAGIANLQNMMNMKKELDTPSTPLTGEKV